MKYYYTDYVRHCLRFFSNFPDEPPEFHSEADKRDYEAAASVIASLSPDVRNSVISYFKNSTLDVPASIIRDVERKIAVERGLK